MRRKAANACLSFVTNVRRRLPPGIIQKVAEDELDPTRGLHTFFNRMSTQRILLVVGGLSFVALLLAATALHAGGSTAPPSNVTARVTGEPVNDPAAPGTPPEPQPLAPLPPPVAENVAVAAATAPTAAAVVGSAAQVAVTAAAVATPAVATPAAKPAALPPDVVDDSRSITGSTFDHRDYIDRHPVDSDRSIAGSKFDRSDAIDDHPVP